MGTFKRSIKEYVRIFACQNNRLALRSKHFGTWKKGPRKSVPWKKNPRKNTHLEKRSPAKEIPGKISSKNCSASKEC